MFDIRSFIDLYSISKFYFNKGMIFWFFNRSIPMSLNANSLFQLSSRRNVILGTFVLERSLISRCKIWSWKQRRLKVFSRGDIPRRGDKDLRLADASSFHGSMQNANSTVISVSCQRKTIHAMSPIMEIMSHSGFRCSERINAWTWLWSTCCTEIYLICVFYLYTHYM